MRSTVLRWLLAVLLGLLVTAAPVRGDPARHGFEVVDVEGQGSVRLHYEERGSGPTVVLVHGLGASTYFWRRIAPSLARNRHVIALDLKGFGRSAKPEDGRYRITDQARLLAAFLRQRGLAHVTVVGHSLGGAVALAAAIESKRRDPGLIDRLVLIAAPAYPQSLPEPIIALQKPGLGEALLDIASPWLIARLTLHGATLDTSRIMSADIEAYARPLASAGGRAALIATARTLDAELYENLIARYRTLAVPTLLIWCRGDRIVPLATGQKLQRNLPRARLEVLEACNHLPPEERPADVLARLLAFLPK
jgi:pimeloyl-ACP methyl ester carboxylesterase